MTPRPTLPSVEEVTPLPAGSSGMPSGRARGAPPRVLTNLPHALPEELLRQTTILPPPKESLLESVLRKLRLLQFARRLHDLRRSWVLFSASQEYDLVVTLGTLEGLFFAALQRFRKRQRPVHIMYDCLWYGGGTLKRIWMRFCLKEVDRCVVWSSVERSRYARAYGLPENKFVFVPHHHSLLRYCFEVGDDGYVFTGGNADRDYALFFAAIRDLPVRCLLATNCPNLLAGLSIPANVHIVSASPAEFRQLMARATIVVMPMRATLLHAGAQQSILNAMFMGKPVILTDPEGGADYIEHDKTGLLVPYGDVAALRRSLLELCENPAKARSLGQNARNMAAPLTTERCNTEMWHLGLSLLPRRQPKSDATVLETEVA